jgi:HEPN domain-containing protein
MAHDSEKNYEEWFEKAHDDELNAASILRHRDGAPNGTCFLSQQMAEKYLKGLLLFHGKEFEKVHDLLRIASLILEVEPEVHKIKNDCKTLNRFYIETRYPGDYPEFHWGDAEEALQAALEIKNFVLSKITP